VILWKDCPEEYGRWHTPDSGDNVFCKLKKNRRLAMRVDKLDLFLLYTYIKVSKEVYPDILAISIIYDISNMELLS
jgi:hypothetical protein